MNVNLRIGLLLLTLAAPLHSLAHLSHPTDYYNAQNTPLLTQAETTHLQQALNKLDLHENDAAWSELGFILHYFPNHPTALILIGELAQQMGHPERATRYYERAIALYPHHAATYNLYGKFLMQTAKYPQAAVQFKKALALNR